ncbi:hypothetical protein AGMMS50267_10720 [Spirochaetia bacterium]|nr:hypothetical protein AGMMS50267_10720 [Spirochaetia bacterium]
MIVGSHGTFTMTEGEISGNTASGTGPYDGKGGGVYLWNHAGQFTKTGGIIYGSNASPDTLKNTATNGDSGGHAVAVNTNSAYPDMINKRRNTTAGAGVNLDSRTAANWE